MRMTICLFLSLLAGAVSAAGDSRFTGSAALAPATPASADARFTLNAALVRADGTQRAGRFALAAHLTAGADAKNTTTACSTGVDLFKNGFET